MTDEDKVKMEYLKRYQVLYNKRYFLWNKMVSPQAINYEPKVGVSSGTGNYRTITDRLFALDEIDKEMLQIENCIKSIENEESRTVLQYKYLLGMSYREICEVMHISKSQLYRIHDNCIHNHCFF